MKRITLILLASVLFLAGCEEDTESVLSEAELVRHTLDRIANNETISADLFSTLEQIHADSIKRLKAGSKTKEMFVSAMADQTADFFSGVVGEQEADFAITSIPMPFSGEAEITLKGLAFQEQPSAPPYLDIPGDYSAAILKEIGAQQAAGHDEWIPLLSYNTGSAEGESLPTESISLNFDKIKMLATVPHTVLMDPALSDEETVATLNDILSSHDIPPVAIALLLPAVQKIRDGASAQSTDPFNAAMVAWLDETVDPAIGGGLDRDIIRRIQATAYLAGLHTLVRSEYENANQDLASLSILHARYRATVIMTAQEVWEK